jgi:hypothetical protein
MEECNWGGAYPSRIGKLKKKKKKKKKEKEEEKKKKTLKCGYPTDQTRPTIEEDASIDTHTHTQTTDSSIKTCIFLSTLDPQTFITVPNI